MTTATRTPTQAIPVIDAPTSRETDAPADPAQLVQDFHDIADQAANAASQAEDTARTAVHTVFKLLNRSRQHANQAVFTPGRTSPAIAACRHMAKANVLEAKARGIASMARQALEQAKSFSHTASTAAHKSADAAMLVPNGRDWYRSWKTSENAQDRAEEAEEHALRAGNVVASLPF